MMITLEIYLSVEKIDTLQVKYLKILLNLWGTGDIGEKNIFTYTVQVYLRIFVFSSPVCWPQLQRIKLVWLN